MSNKMDYEKKFILGDLVKGRRTFNDEIVEGKFNGFHLFDKLDPTSVVGAIDVEDDKCYDVVVESIELLESEDERIRKELIEFFTFEHWDGEAPFSAESARERIAWLEKQGSIDNVPLENSTNTIIIDSKKPKFKVKYANSEYNVLEIKEIAGITLYGIEDEPNHIDYVLSDNCEIISGYSYGVKEKGNQYPTKSAIFSEQKPFWSEEDEKFLTTALWHISNSVSNGKNTEVHCATIEWLKSLKDRIQKSK